MIRDLLRTSPDFISAHFRCLSMACDGRLDVFGVDEFDSDAAGAQTGRFTDDMRAIADEENQ